MIYLVDDKKERQKNIGWSAERLDGYKDVLQPIYDNEHLQKLKSAIFAEHNVMLFHESFFDNPVNLNSTQALEIRRSLSSYVEKHKFTLVTFSGSMGYRKITGNTANIPFETIYQNLQVFIQDYRENNTANLKKLAFGENVLAEEI
ncbi:MAG: hypothetical protein EOO20_16030, partial [Chryseobacterium sp.]